MKPVYIKRKKKACVRHKEQDEDQGPFAASLHPVFSPKNMYVPQIIMVLVLGKPIFFSVTRLVTVSKLPSKTALPNLQPQMSVVYVRSSHS